jgi:dihydroxyacetone kinase
MAASKKLINEVETCVDESIEGFVALHPGLRQLDGQPRVVIRADIEQYKQQGKVTTITGGGSGHEPCFMGK